MQIEQRQWIDKQWQILSSSLLNQSAQIVFGFGSRTVLEDAARFAELREAYPEAHLILCSTSGEIAGERVFDETLVTTALVFEHTEIKVTQIQISEGQNSRLAGEQLVSQLPLEGLTYLLVISDGQWVNGSELVQGIHAKVPSQIPVTGGLAGDAARFQRTLVGWNVPPQSGVIVAVGFYGTRLKVGHGSFGGWDAFGAERLITKSQANVLYELDGQSALDLYKTYLGEEAKGLPATALLFPLSIKIEGQDQPVVRTILSIDEATKSLTFAGDMPEGSRARLMKANFDRLIDGAEAAASRSFISFEKEAPELAILISCVGRKLVLGQRIDEEVEGVRDILGQRPVLMGFYSYGEISPIVTAGRCELHNQTMTITTLAEV